MNPVPQAPQAPSSPVTQSFDTAVVPAQGMASIRRAFAGHGTPVMHFSWLLNGEQAKAFTVRSSIMEILKLHNIPRLSIHQEKLVERGILMEEREYLTVARGVSTVFIFVTPAGRDLYISRATTVLPAISNVRAFVVGLLLFIMFLGFFIHPSTYGLLSGDVTGFVAGSILTILSIPLLLFFIWLLVRSFISWLVEKDFWMFLRPNTLNDFQLDEIALLEHLTDEVVRSAVEQAGLDASKIIAPPLGYLPKRRVRAI